MKNFKFRWLATAALAAASVIAIPAQAQRVQRIVAFGDSYADDGNLFELLGIPRPAVYPNGRFSNGTNFVDTMSLRLGVPVDNFAIGGAFAGNGNINGPGIPGFVTEYQSFLAGGGPAAFPRVSGSFGPQDLAVISIGGNDARAYERSLGLTPSAAQISGLIAGVPGQAALRVAETTTGINALYAAGARNFTFLVGDVGRLPEVRGLPVAAVGTAYANAYNAGVQSSLADLARRGAIVNYLDLTVIGNVVEANLAAFGLTSAGACPVACVTTNPELLDRYLFYVDQVHLTSRGFEIVGVYAVRQLEAPLHLEAQSEAALIAATVFGESLMGRLDLSDTRTGTAHRGPPLRLFLGGTYGRLERPASLTSLGYTATAGGVTGGVEYDTGTVTVGVAGSWSQPDARLQGIGELEGEALQVGVYGAVGFGGAFAQAYASIGRVDLETGRDGVISRIEGAPEGDLVTAGGRVGYLFDLGALRVGPVAGVRYSRATLDRYTETGDPVLTLNVGEQEIESTIGSIGIEAQGGFDVAGTAFHPYIAATIEDEIGDAEDHAIQYAGTASPTIVNTWRLASREADAHGRLTGGVNIGLSNAITLQVAASATVGRDQGNEGSGSVGVRVGF